MTHRASLSFVQTYLRNASIVPRKSFSQNFLIDANIARKIVEQMDIQTDDCVIEVGPGLGALTEWILKFSEAVTVIEKDPHLIPALHTFIPTPQIYNEDILKVDWNLFLPKGKKALLLTNLPYNISKEFIVKLCEHSHRISSCLILVQKEFAEKLLAHPKSPQYRFVTVLCRLFSEVSSLFDIPPHLFYPHAGVHSRLIRLNMKDCSLGAESIEILKHSFLHRRKSLLNSLKESNMDSSTVELALHKIGKNSGARAEDLSPEEWTILLEICKN